MCSLMIKICWFCFSLFISVFTEGRKTNNERGFPVALNCVDPKKKRFQHKGENSQIQEHKTNAGQSIRWTQIPICNHLKL